MQRYFLEVAYKGTRYSGFQKQENANTIQAEIEKAFQIIHRKPVALTGSSRTDAGVHALQNFFHFDFDDPLNPQALYKMNAITPDDIVVKGIYPVNDAMHSRFDAISRAYEYRITTVRDPFLLETALYYPYKLDMGLLSETGSIVKEQSNFFAFAKTNTQVNNFNCKIYKSQWSIEGNKILYEIEGNRFLRGMVRLLTASQLKVARGNLAIDSFVKLFEHDQKCGFSVPATGLFLSRVNYPIAILGL